MSGIFFKGMLLRNYVLNVFLLLARVVALLWRSVRVADGARLESV